MLLSCNGAWSYRKTRFESIETGVVTTRLTRITSPFTAATESRGAFDALRDLILSMFLRSVKTTKKGPNLGISVEGERHSRRNSTVPSALVEELSITLIVEATDDGAVADLLEAALLEDALHPRVVAQGRAAHHFEV